MSKKSSAKKRKSAKAKSQVQTNINKPVLKESVSDPLKKVTDELLDELENEVSDKADSKTSEAKKPTSEENISKADAKTVTASDEPHDEPDDEPNDEPNDEPDDEPNDEPDDEPNDEPNDNPINESSDDHRGKNPDSPERLKRRAVFLYLLAVIGVILLPFINLLVYGLLPHETEIGKEIHLPLKEMPFLSSSCEVKTELEQIDTSVIGKHPLELEFFGFIPVKSTLVVRDSTAPTITTHSLYIPRGVTVQAEDFIEKAKDKTKLTYSIRGKVDYENGGTVKLCVTDEFGNKTNCTAELIITDQLSSLEIELGTKRFDLTYELLKHGHLNELNFDTVDFSECGTYRVKGNFDGVPCLFDLTIVDTTAPSAQINSYDIILGQTLEAKDFIKNEFDRSEIKKYFLEAPDFEKLGTQVITVILEDEHGNTSRLSSLLNIHDIEPSFTIEAGTTNEIFKNELPQKSAVNDFVPYLPDEVSVNELPIGTHEIELQGEHSRFTIELTVIDTIAPVMTLKSIHVYSTSEPDAADFIVGCEDASEVTFEFSGDVDTTLLGEQIVTIIATDAAGNFTSMSTSMYVIKDTEKPVIYGVKPLIFSEGETVSYRKGISAVDNCDGEVNVIVDSSRVNTSVAGVYYVTYTASDSAGNTATASTTVTIGAINRQRVDELADRLISRIITSTMTQRQKAEAIYNWCAVNIRYSSATSHLMGYFNQAAYTGLTKYYGNCYTYYAVASALLTRVGIENIEIHRNDPTRPHYWNLVKMDGSWYHFDTCPQPSPHRLRVFLLTDSEVRAFPLDYYYNFDASNYPATP